MFKEVEEQNLFFALKNLVSLDSLSSKIRGFDHIFESLSTLIPVINAYFDKIMINVPEVSVRHNRLNTLALCRALIQEFADFSKIEMNE